MAKPQHVSKVVLAYSGGLDTSIIIPWLKENYGCDVVAFSADVGQNEELDGLEAKALASGASKLYVEDLKEEFLKEYAFPTLRAGALYERKYLLGTSFARPIIAAHQVAIARLEGADALAHGCTGKGNDQVRFELTFQALAPEMAVIAPRSTTRLHTTSRSRHRARTSTAGIATCGTTRTRADNWKIPGSSRPRRSSASQCRLKTRPTSRLRSSLGSTRAGRCHSTDSISPRLSF